MLLNQYQIYKREKHKIMKKRENNYLPTKNFWKTKHWWYKSVITEHPKTSHKLCMTILQTEKVGSNSSLYSYTKNKNKKYLSKNL